MADISATLPAWSTTRSSNAPSGSTPIGTGLDDNLREIQGVVRGWLASQGAAIVAASTTDLGAVEGVYHTITGATAITSFGTVAAGIWKMLRFESTPLITYNATSLILPTAGSITAEAGDTMLVISEGSGNWRCIQYTRASGLALADSGGSGGVSGFSTGDVKGTLKLAADPGWVMLNDGTIGDASSGATTRANADCAALFALLWTATDDFYSPVSGGRGASGAADFAAHKTIRLPKTLGRALCASGVSADVGVIAKTHGGVAGADTATAELAAHVHAITDPFHGHFLNDPQHIHGNLASFTGTNSVAGFIGTGETGPADGVGSYLGIGAHTPEGTVTMTNAHAATGMSVVVGQSGINTTLSAGSGGGHNNIQPSLYINWMICL